MNKIITIIPAYNTPVDWFTDAVLSIARQNTRHKQILVIVDDGSKRTPIKITPKIKKGLGENPLLSYALVRHRTNKSVGAALNTGIEYAKKIYGIEDDDYIFCFGSDDYLDSSFFEKGIEFYEKSESKDKQVGMVSFTNIHMAGNILITKTKDGNMTQPLVKWKVYKSLNRDKLFAEISFQEDGKMFRELRDIGWKWIFEDKGYYVYRRQFNSETGKETKKRTLIMIDNVLKNTHLTKSDRTDLINIIFLIISSKLQGRSIVNREAIEEAIAEL